MASTFGFGPDGAGSIPARAARSRLYLSGQQVWFCKPVRKLRRFESCSRLHNFFLKLKLILIHTSIYKKLFEIFTRCFSCIMVSALVFQTRSASSILVWSTNFPGIFEMISLTYLYIRDRNLAWNHKILTAKKTFPDMENRSILHLKTHTAINDLLSIW